jgi:hypothetical protein
MGWIILFSVDGISGVGEESGGLFNMCLYVAQLPGEGTNFF